MPNDLFALLRSLPTAELYRRMPQIEADRAKLQMLDAELLALDRRLWVPLPGPQEEAYDSPADELFFGGAAGPGKTQLLLGLAYTKHRRAIVFRREYSQLREIIEHRIARGEFRGKSAAELVRQRIERVAGQRAAQYVNELSDGRHIAVSTQPMPNGGTGRTLSGTLSPGPSA